MGSVGKCVRMWGEVRGDVGRGVGKCRGSCVKVTKYVGVWGKHWGSPYIPPPHLSLPPPHHCFL